MSVGTLVSVVALGVTAFVVVQSSSPAEGRLSIAAVTLGDPVDLSAILYEATGDISRTPADDVPVAPIDITLKNDGGSVVSISTVNATILEVESIQSCDPRKRGAGGVGLAAEYALQIPTSAIYGEGESVPLSSDIDFTVDPGESGRLAVTVGPEQQAENAVIIFAVNLSFGLQDGSTIETGPIVAGATQPIIDEFIALASELEPSDGDIATLCQPELEKIENVLGVGGTIAEPIERLRGAYGRLV